MSVESLVPRVREALGVSNSYDEVTIPAGIRRALKKLLRDYNFPKSIRQRSWNNHAFVPEDKLNVGQFVYPIPKGMKKELMLMYVSPGDDPPKTMSWSEPLRKLEGFRMPNDGGTDLAMYYWLEGLYFHIDRALSVDPPEQLMLALTYQSWDVLENEDWLMDDYEDIIYTLSTFRMAAEMRKPEVMQAYGALWQEEMTSLAIYVNELEYDNLYMMQREATRPAPARYPI